MKKTTTLLLMVASLSLASCGSLNFSKFKSHEKGFNLLDGGPNQTAEVPKLRGASQVLGGTIYSESGHPFKTFKEAGVTYRHTFSGAYNASKPRPNLEIDEARLEYKTLY